MMRGKNLEPRALLDVFQRVRVLAKRLGYPSEEERTIGTPHCTIERLGLGIKQMKPVKRYDIRESFKKKTFQRVSKVVSELEYLQL